MSGTLCAVDPGYADAVAVRRWDDQAKDPAVPTPAFADFTTLIGRIVGSGQ
jgi:gamma-butyrobetaine dioxygenase